MKYATAIYMLLAVLICSALGVQAKEDEGKSKTDLHISLQTLLGEDPAAHQLKVPSLPQKALAEALTIPPYHVRIVYLIPNNRIPQYDAEKTLQRHALRVQRLFREELARLGYAQKNLRLEMQPDGVVPKINIVWVDLPDTYFHSTDYLTRWDRIILGVQRGGIAIWQPGEILWVFAETQKQFPNGEFDQSTIFFGGAGDGVIGVGLVTGETLARLTADLLIDDAPFAGTTIPGISYPVSYPLTESSFPWFEGTTLSSTSSSAQGGSAHEVAHALGLFHDFRNDVNFNGNLTGNGFRGFHGWFYPNRYPADDVMLSRASAIAFNSNRYFNADGSTSGTTGPSIQILSSGLVIPSQGLFPVRFTATGPSSLVGAMLVRNGAAVAEMPLNGTSITTTITANDYTPVRRLSSSTDTWELFVYDKAGNRASATISAAPASGYNRAPIPFVKLSKRRLTVGDQVVLDASQSVDPDGDASRMRVEWDTNGDGSYETAASRTKTYTTTYTTAGVYKIVARLTDRVGNRAISMPIGLRVESPSIDNLASLTLAPTSANSSVCPDGFSERLEKIATVSNKGNQALIQLRLEVKEQETGVILVRVGDMWMEEGELFDLPKAQGYSDSQLTSNEAVQIPLTACLENAPFSASSLSLNGRAQ